MIMIPKYVSITSRTLILYLNPYQLAFYRFLLNFTLLFHMISKAAHPPPPNSWHVLVIKIGIILIPRWKVAHSLSSLFEQFYSYTDFVMFFTDFTILIYVLLVKFEVFELWKTLTKIHWNKMKFQNTLSLGIVQPSSSKVSTGRMKQLKVQRWKRCDPTKPKFSY